MKIVKPWNDSKIQLEFDFDELNYLSCGAGLLRSVKGWNEDMFVLSYNIDSVCAHGKIYPKEELKEEICAEFS